MEQQDKKITIPCVNLRQDSDGCVVSGYFGRFPLLDLKKGREPLQEHSQTYLHDVCRGPYLDFKELNELNTDGSAIQVFDDCFAVCRKKQKEIIIYDHNSFNNQPKGIDWYDWETRPKPIWFEPKMTLQGTHVEMKDLKNLEDVKTPQNYTKKMVLDTLKGMFGEDYYATSNRSFIPYLPEGPKMQGVDYGFLLKTGHGNFSWYLR